ncbi:MAG: zinc ribbon domain-containing protein, partial [Ignavibacteria bacterium]
MKTCTNCGNEVREIDNFCPNCGQKLKTEQSSEIQSRILKIKICDLCGEENPVDAEECSYCGVGFSGKEKIIEKEFIQPRKKTTEIDEKNLKVKSAKSPEHFKKKKTTQKKEDRQTKVLETKHFLIIGILIIIIGLMLIFYNSDSTKKGMQNPQQEIQSGIDLNALNEINQLENELKND